jgi:hypothetical protein
MNRLLILNKHSVFIHGDDKPNGESPLTAIVLFFHESTSLNEGRAA